MRIAVIVGNNTNPDQTMWRDAMTESNPNALLTLNYGAKELVPYDQTVPEILGRHVPLWKSGHRVRFANSGVNSVTVTPDGKYLISGSSDKTCRLWNLATGSCIRIFEGHTSGVNTVTVTPDSKYMISGSTDGTCRLWNLATGDCIRIFEGHTHSVNSVTVTPDGKRLISGNWLGTIRFWDLSTGTLLATLYNRYQGFLWTTPPEKNAPDGYFWTDRPDLIQVIKRKEDGSDEQAVTDKQERDEYIMCHNRQRIVMGRINGREDRITQPVIDDYEREKRRQKRKLLLSCAQDG